MPFHVGLTMPISLLPGLFTYQVIPALADQSPGGAHASFGGIHRCGYSEPPKTLFPLGHSYQH